MAITKTFSNKSVASLSPADLARITQEMYKQNLELSERNKTLSLLRKIDEIVLSSITKPEEVGAQIVQTVAQETSFAMAAIYILDKRRATLMPIAISNKSGTIGEIEAQQKLKRTHITLHSLLGKFDKIHVGKQIETTRVLDIMTPFLSSDEEKEIRAALDVKTFFICPLHARNELLGVMVIGCHQRRGNISRHQRNLIERLTGAIGVAIDNSLLYQRVEDTTGRLRNANRHLKELDVAKDEFISMASHQLRTPLTSIKGYLSMLIEGDAGKMSKLQREFVGYAYDSSERMVDLIADLLNVSRMSAGKFVLELKLCDLSAVVADEVRRLQSHAVARGLTLEYSPPKSRPHLLEIDEGKTRQVIMNFIDNALYYTQKGGVKVTLAEVGGAMELRVKDTGIGVPKSERAKLFHKFYRADNAQMVRPDGTGLGLFLAKRVVADQGGTIIFESVEGKGSTFGFRLPLNKAKIGAVK